jgi:hypothetical protein
MKDFKFLTLVIPYLTICGSLYHISYWDKFNINGLSFISLQDIIKSSIYPVFSIVFSIIYSIAISNLTFADKKSEQNKYNLNFSNLNLFFIYLGSHIFIRLFFLIFNNKDPYVNVFFAFINVIVISIYIINTNFLKQFFSSEILRRYAINFIVFIPVFSYYTGKYQSEQVYQNLKYKYVINPSKYPINNALVTSDTLKFLGNSDQFFIFSDLNNSSQIFISKNDLHTLIMFDKK